MRTGSSVWPTSKLVTHCGNEGSQHVSAVLQRLGRTAMWAVRDGRTARRAAPALDACATPRTPAFHLRSNLGSPSSAQKRWGSGMLTCSAFNEDGLHRPVWHQQSLPTARNGWSRFSVSPGTADMHTTCGLSVLLVLQQRNSCPVLAAKHLGFSHKLVSSTLHLGEVKLLRLVLRLQHRVVLPHLWVS